MPYFIWKLELVPNILWMVVWKIPPRKMSLPEKYRLENLTLESFPPENFPPENCPHPPWFSCEFFLTSTFYFCENFRRQVKSIFIQFNFLIMNNNLSIFVVVVVIYFLWDRICTDELNSLVSSDGLSSVSVLSNLTVDVFDLAWPCRKVELLIKYICIVNGTNFHVTGYKEM